MGLHQVQDAHTVAYRTFCLAAILTRLEIEVMLQSLDEYALPDTIRQGLLGKHVGMKLDLWQWLEREGIAPYLTRTERQLLHQTPGTWPDRLLVNTSWRIESLGVMLWALRAIDEMPPFDTRFALDELLPPLEVLTPTVDFIWLAELRPADELATMRDCADLWNWRSRAAELQRMGMRPPEGTTFAEIIFITAQQARSKGIPPLINGDFPAFGHAYADQTEDQFAITSGIAYERSAALNWLCELSSEWQSISVDL
jgi:hypothetical protein